MILQTIGYLGRMRGSEGTFTAVAGWLLQLYAGFYLAVSAAVSRVQEVEADRAAARLAGRQSGITALQELGVLDGAWRFYLDNYVGDLRGIALAPAGVLAEFPTLLAGRSEELAKSRSQPPSSVTSQWDSHPSSAERISQLRKEPEPAGSTDDRPPEEIAAQPGCRFLPYEEIAAAQVVRKTPLKITFHQHSGEQVTLRQSLRTGELANGWDALREITAQHHAATPPGAGGAQR